MLHVYYMYYMSEIYAPFSTGHLSLYVFDYNYDCSRYVCISSFVVPCDVCLHVIMLKISVKQITHRLLSVSLMGPHNHNLSLYGASPSHGAIKQGSCVCYNNGSWKWKTWLFTKTVDINSRGINGGLAIFDVSSKRMSCIMILLIQFCKVKRLKDIIDFIDFLRLLNWISTRRFWGFGEREYPML